MRPLSQCRTGLAWLSLLGGAVACGGGGTEPGGPPPTAPVATVSVTPAADTVIIRATRQLTAVLRDSAGTVLTGRSVTWSVSDPVLASVSSTGLVTATAPGVVKVAITSEQKSDTATLTLAPILTVGPRLPSLFAGDTVHLVASLRDALGGGVAGSVLWTSRRPAKATVSGGVVTALDSGLVTVVASGLAVAESVVVAVLVPAVGLNREIAYLTDSARSDGWQIPTLRTYLPGDPASMRVSGFDEYVSEYAWSPDGNRLVVSYLNYNGLGRGGLYTINADGSGEVPLGALGAHPRWSPDNTRIAYRSTSGAARIRVAMANGSGDIPLTTGGPDDLDPEWSPDGRQIVFRRQSTFCEQMFTVDADGSHQRQVVVPILPCKFHWSPDGKLIAIFAAAKPYSGFSGIWVVRPDGTGFRAVSPNCNDTGSCPGGGAIDEANWSRDGTALVMSGANGMVYVWSRTSEAVDSFAVPQLCCATYSASASWSPDGTSLVYVGPYIYQPLDIVQPLIGVMNPDGSNQTPVINFHIQAGTPGWRP